MLPARNRGALPLRRGLRNLALAVTALGLFGVSACEQQDGVAAERAGAGDDVGGPLTEPDMRVDQVATGEPGKDRLYWRPADDRSRTVGGFLTASLPQGRGGPLVLAFANGVTLQLELSGLRKGAEPSGVQDLTFADVLGSLDEAGVYLYRVIEEQKTAAARAGGLCGEDETTYAAVSEYVGPDGEWSLRFASFKGAAAPGEPDAAPAQLCSRYTYRLG